jgi:hypothetical protein
MMKIDYTTARMQTHRRNIRRYSRLLATPLTDLERQYLHRRIAEEQAELERLAQTEHLGQRDHQDRQRLSGPQSRLTIPLQ